MKGLCLLIFICKLNEILHAKCWQKVLDKLLFFNGVESSMKNYLNWKIRETNDCRSFQWYSGALYNSSSQDYPVFWKNPFFKLTLFYWVGLTLNNLMLNCGGKKGKLQMIFAHEQYEWFLSGRKITKKYDSIAL